MKNARVHCGAAYPESQLSGGFWTNIEPISVAKPVGWFRQKSLQTFPRPRGIFTKDMAMNVPSDSLVGSGQPLSLISQVKHGEKQNYNPDFWHMRFRGFSPLEGSDRIQDLRRISELCYQWLRPDLNSKEQILDQLVLEQFVICMPPELQALVKESGVKSCKDLEKMLKEGKPHKWSIIYSQGQAYLRDPSVEKAEATQDKWNHMDLSQEHLSNESEESLNRGQASPELQNLSETEEHSTSQEEDLLLGLISERRRADYLRPEQSLGSDSIPDWEETEVSVFVGQDLQPTQGPAGSLRVNAVLLPKETGVDAVPSFTHILEQDLALNRDLQSLRGFNIPTSKGVASYMGNTEDGLEPANPQPANPQPANPQPANPQPANTQPANTQPACTQSACTQSANPPPVEQVDSLPVQARFQCTKCKKSFLYRSHFDLHQRSHTGERPFKCDLCKKAFLQSSDLRVHQRVHTGEKPYTCSVCRKEFAHRSTLKSHSRVHMKEKPYVCENCGQRFSHKCNLTVHFRIHLDLRPYICKKCDKAFRQHGTWKRHMNIHLRKASV